MDKIPYELYNKFDVTWFAKPEFNEFQMCQIRLGLEKGLDVSWYAKPDFTWRQM